MNDIMRIWTEFFLDCIYFEISFISVVEVIVDLRMFVADYDKYLFTSFQKLQTIISIIIPMGKAAIMLTV